MGRPRRQTGHLADTFSHASLRPKQGPSHGALSSPQPLHNQPQFSLAIHQQTRQLGYPQQGDLLIAEIYTPSTTDSLSPVSSRAALSPGSTSATTSYTEALQYNRHFSPDAPTPTSSVTSQSRHDRLHRSEHATEPNLQPAAFNSNYELGLSHAMTVDVLGIDTRAPFHETARYISHNPQFISPNNPSPTGHERYPVTSEPWSGGHPFRHEDQHHAVAASSPDAMEIDTPRSPNVRDRGGGRTGPLTPVQRQEASNVRRRGACLRCTVMREKCDCSYPCNRCSRKDRRKCPRPCIPKDVDWDSCKTGLFPDELTLRLRKDHLFQYLASATFTLSDQSTFEVPLDLHIGEPLYVTVKEFCPLHTALEFRHAFQPFQDSEGKKSYGKYHHWNPPVVMYIRPGHLDKTILHVRKNITDMFNRVLDDPKKFRKWTLEYFDEGTVEDFPATILGLMGDYYRKDLEEHSVLRAALSLLWFEYLLLNKFTIPPKCVPELVANLESGRPVAAHQDIYVIPDTINRFLKMIILPMAEKAAEHLLKALHERMFKMAVTQKLSQTSMDLVLCMLFVLMIFLGRTQNALLLLAQTPADEIGMHYSTKAAKAKIEEMENTVSDYLLSFHKYTLSRAASKLSTSSESDLPCDTHARQFDLVHQLGLAIEEDYGKLDACSSNQRLWSDKVAEDERPCSLDLDQVELDTFRYMNVRRLCWKVVTNIGL